MAEERKRRTSHVLELLQKQKEDREAAEAENAESGGDQPFPDFAAELGLGGFTGDGEK